MKTRLDCVYWFSLAGFILFSAMVGLRLLYPIDLWALEAAQGYASERLDAAAELFSIPGTLEYVAAAILVLATSLFFTGRRLLAGRLLAAFVVTGLLELAMKLWLPQVPVPEEAARSTDPTPVVEVSYPYPYPSGHMLRSTILLGAMILLWPNRLARVVLVSVLAGVAVSRVYLGVHWASDVIGGALLGTAGLAWVFRAGLRSTVSSWRDATGRHIRKK